MPNAEIELHAIGLKADHIQKMGTLFIAHVTFDKELSDEIYENITNNKCVSIVSDTSSQKRGEEVSQSLYLVESHLRNLLLHMPDLAGTYLDIIAAKATHYRGSAVISKTKSADVITSQLTLGQITEVFESNTSKDSNETLTWRKLLDVLDGSSDLVTLKKRIENEIKPVTIWDVISEHVLKKPIELADITAKLARLRSIRDTAAHYRIVTPKELRTALFLSKSLISELQIKQLTIADQAALHAADEKASDVIKSTIESNGDYPSYLADAPIDAVVDPWGMYNRESVSYTAWKVHQKNGHMPYWGGYGNANQWPGNAKAAGIEVSNAPRPESVAISMNGAYGHAMWVEDVLADGQIKVSQYNNNLRGSYTESIMPARELVYIYF